MCMYVCVLMYLWEWSPVWIFWVKRKCISGFIQHCHTPLLAWCLSLLSPAACSGRAGLSLYCWSVLSDLRITRAICSRDSLYIGCELIYCGELANVGRLVSVAGPWSGWLPGLT